MKKEELKLPMTHDRCPVCGNEGGLVRRGIESLVEKGEIDKDSFPGGVVLTIPMMDRKKPKAILTATVKVWNMMIYYEVCDNPDCMALYCTRFDLVQQEIPAQVYQWMMGQQAVPKDMKGFFGG
jgi:hypothetical protein